MARPSCVPYEESCAQVGAIYYDYTSRAKHECRLFIEAIRAKLGAEPDGAVLRVKANPHDWGTHYSVRCYYETDKPDAVDYAFKCESDAPATWAEVGMTAPYDYFAPF